MAAQIFNRLGQLGMVSDRDALNELHIFTYNLSLFNFPTDDYRYQGLAIGGAVVNSALFNVDGGHRAVIFDRLSSHLYRLYKV